MAFADENVDFLQLSHLKEKRILIKGLFFFVPGVIYGILSMYFPYVYMAFPCQESAICVCSFFQMQRDGD